MQHVLLGVQRLGEDQRRCRRSRWHRDHPVAGVAGRDGADRLCWRRRRRPRPRAAPSGRASDRRRRCTPCRAVDEDRSGRRRRRARHDGTWSSRVSSERVGLGRPVGAVEQGVVEGGLQLHPHGDVGAQRHERDGEADRHRGQQDDPAGQGAAVVPAPLVPLPARRHRPRSGGPR